MKFALTLSLFCLSCFAAFAESMQITILAKDRYNISESGILKGAKEYASKAKIRLGKDINIDIKEAQNGDFLKKQIISLKEEGQSALILSLAESSLPTGFDEFLAQVSCDTFNIAIINPKKNFENALLLLNTDRQKELELISAFVKEKSRNFTTKTIYLFESDKIASIDKAEASKLISSIFNEEEFNILCANTKDNDFFAINNISSFETSQAEYLAKLDSYAIIITSRQLLEGLSELKADRDRRFIISLESNAFSLSNMDTGLLSATMVQDYFGYGFLSSKALIEKTLEGITPSEKLQKLSPTLYTTETLEELKATCLYWLK